MAEFTHGLSDTELEAFKTFFFIVFKPNPAKDRVSIIIDDGNIRTSMRIKNFIDVCVSLIGIKIQDPLAKALEEVGCFFLLDRQNCSLKPLQLTHEREFLSVKDVFETSRENLENIDNQVISVNNLVEVNKRFGELPIKKLDKKNKLRTFQSGR